MSLIKKIVEIVDRSDNIDARKNIAKLHKDIKSYKEKVKQFFDSNYAEFMPAVISNETLLDEGSHFEHELLNLKQNLNNQTKDMYQANDEISKLVEELEEVNLKLKLSLKLMKIDKLLQKIKQYHETEKYSEINGAINKIQLLLNDPEDFHIIRRLDMYPTLKARLVQERNSMLKSLENRFNNLVQTKEKSFLKTRSVVMSISKDNAKLVDCANAIVDSDYELKEIIKFLMEKVFEPIISRAVSLEVAEDEKEFSMSLSYSIEPITDELRPSYSAAFINIRQVLSYFLNMNVQLQSGEYFLPHIFQDCRSQLLNLIFNECLVHSIPTTFDAKNKCTMKEDIKKLSETFEELNFFPAIEDEPKLEDYAAKVDELFYSEFSKSIQSSASDMLKRDLHDMMLVSEDTTISTQTPLTFPRSMVSKSTFELIRFIETIIRQSTTADGDSDKQNNLMLAVRSVLQNFTFTVQLHHAKFMSKIPQQSALFYNNCMYLANWVTSNLDTDHYGMDQIVDGLQKQGWEVLELQITKQKIQLLELLAEFDPSQSLNVFQPEHFKPIRQCIRQMDLLKNVWQTILPSELYNKTIAGLLDVISLDLIKKLTVMEDISTILANGLVELIKTIDEKGQSLFEANTSALSVVPSWQKMLHLKFILEASLVDITKSWKTGQITQSFKSEEVKRLIRALFQNTDRRANALSAIV